MEFEIKKEGNEKYLSIQRSKFDENDYHIQMIMNNNIKGLLPIKIRNINNEKELLYEISTMISLINIFDRSLIKKEELLKLVIAIKQLEDNLKEYLLSANHIKFDLNYIYYRSKQNQYYFCYCPEEVDDFNLQMKTLFNQILDHINYNDRETVSIAYSMQEITSRDDFALEELLELGTSEVVLDNPASIEEDDAEYDYEEDDERQKESFLDKIKQVFRKKKKEKDYEEDIYIEEIDNEDEYNFDTDNLSDEEATVLLAQNRVDFMALKSTNQNPEIIIVPDKYPFVIGKSKRSSDYRVSSDVISRVHARINCELGEFSIEDLNSTNGTFVNDERLKPHEIKEIERGDVVKLADLEFSVE